MKIDRRKALSLLAATSIAPLPVSAKERPRDVSDVEFLHGLASGDPNTDSVLLWTRVTPPKTDIVGNTMLTIHVSWEIAADRGFRHVVDRGILPTDPSRDFTVKVVADGLRPGKEYFYRFRAGKAVSPVGRTRTLPEDHIEDVVLAFVTCSLYPAGYFNAYDHIARRERLDAVVELGDYYYEYGAGQNDYAMEIGRKLNRIPDPPHDTVTLADYRTRHAQYKSDPDLQAAHARTPWICVWDDHETANDSWVGGAENHNPKTEGPWITREQAALRAYYEWMPIREPEPGRAFETINRSFPFGDLATLIMVETRLVARSRQLEYDRPGDVPLAIYDSADPATRKPVSDPATVQAVMTAIKSGNPPPAPYVVGPNVAALRAIIEDPERQMLGARQEEWVKLEIAKSVAAGKPWQIFGNQVVMARTQAPDIQQALGGPEKIAALAAKLPGATGQQLATFATYFSFDIPMDLDGWDGYPAARERMYDAIKASNANAVIVSGDSHAFWVNQLFDKAGTKVAAEFGVSSITSPSVGEALPMLDVAKLIMDGNREVLLNDQRSHGYTLLTVTRDAVVGEHVSVDKLAKPYSAATLARYRVTPAAGPGIGEITRV
jgi:alkaline phosphatase D